MASLFIDPAALDAWIEREPPTEPEEQLPEECDECGGPSDGPVCHRCSAAGNAVDAQIDEDLAEEEAPF